MKTFLLVLQSLKYIKANKTNLYSPHLLFVTWLEFKGPKFHCEPSKDLVELVVMLSCLLSRQCLGNKLTPIISLVVFIPGCCSSVYNKIAFILQNLDLFISNLFCLLLYERHTCFLIDSLLLTIVLANFLETQNSNLFSVQKVNIIYSIIFCKEKV